MEINGKTEGLKKLSLANPSYNSETGAAIWSCIYFGSYPQTEVKGDNLLPGIRDAEYNQDGDAWADGIRYKRIGKEHTENLNFFGNSRFRYFKWEKIKWRVLFNDGKTLFVAASQGIDCKAYNDANVSVTWENCTLRHWLNNDFLNMAFDDNEQKVIVTYKVQNEPTEKYRKGNGNNTNDKIYLLSIPELRNPAYGFWEEKMDWGHKKDKKMNRRIKPSDYAHARGASVCTRQDTGVTITKDAIGNCRWWLRSSSKYTNYGAEANEWGGIFDVGYHTRIFEDAVVPVMHLDLEKFKSILQ